MENLPPLPVEPAPSIFRPCPLCHAQNPDWLPFCSQCGASIRPPEQSAQAELAHIAYVLWELPAWRFQDLISPDAATRLHDDYSERQHRLKAWIASIPKQATDTPHARVVPPLPVVLLPRNFGALPLQTSFSVVPIPTQSSEFWSRPAISTAPAPSAAPPRPARTPRGIAVFLQEHALKIVFALATVLVLIALRSILGWNATNAAFLALTPLLSLGLTAMFWQFGRRTQQENPWAAFVYQGLTAVLLGFDLFMIDRFWLAAAGMNLSTKPLLLLAGTLSTLSCGLIWRRHRYLPMWHLFQTGLLTVLYAALQTARLLLWQQANWRPAPLLLFGLAYLGAAAFYFGKAALHPGIGSTDDAKSPALGRPAWILWANLSVAMSFVLSTLALGFESGMQSEHFLLVVLLAGALYGVIAQALEDARLVYVAAVLGMGGGLAWIPSHFHLGASSYSVLSIAVSAVALAFYTYDRRFPTRRALTVAWKHVASVGSALGLFVTAGQMTLALFPFLPSEQHAASAMLRAGLALIGGLQFLWMAVLEGEVAFCYPGCLSGGIALFSLLEAMHVPLERYPLALSGYAAALLFASYRKKVAQNPSGSKLPLAPALWETFHRCGKIALGLSLTWSSLLGVAHPHSPWLLASLLLAGVQCGILGSREDAPHWRYTALYACGCAFALLTLTTAPGKPTLSHCLLPFALFSAIGAFSASLIHTARTASPTATLPRQIDLWREPLADAGLVALGSTLFAAWAQMQQRVAQPSLALDAAICLAAALLLAASRHFGATDGRRFVALALLNVATALGIAWYTGLATVETAIPSVAWLHFGLGLLLQSWGYWILARALSLFSAAEVWSEDLSRLTLGPVSLSAILATAGAFSSASPATLSTIPPVLMIGGAFALYHLEMLRSRKTEILALSLGALLLSGVILLFARDGIQPYLLLTLATCTVLATASYLQLARRLENVGIACLSALTLLGGASLALLQSASARFAVQDVTCANGVWIAGGLALTWSYLSAAKWSDRTDFVYVSGVTLICTYLRAFTWAFHLPSAWDALLLLPLLLGMGTLALYPPKSQGRLQFAYLQVAVTASILALCWTILRGDGCFGAVPSWMPNLATATLAAYGVAYLAWMAVRKTALPLIAGATTLTLAYLNLLLSKTPAIAAEHSTLSWPLFAFLSIQAALVWMGIGAFLKKAHPDKTLASPLLHLTQAIALFSAVSALLCLQEPHPSVLVILTLVMAAGVWFGLWALDQGDPCIHIGTGNLLVAWGLTVYQTMGAELDLLDVYLLPFGLYLLLMGHLLSRRRKQSEAQTFWGIGLLVTLTPALLTRWMHAPGWHAALLLSECIVCVLWGVAQRIRVFVAGGLGTILLYAASLSLGILPDTLTTLLALLAGVGLFIFGFYALTHQERMKQLAAKIQQRWTVWHSWR